MRVNAFSFELPEELIARYPLPERGASRLLMLDGATGKLTHGHFVDLLEQLRPHDLLVFNDTRVIPARLWGHKTSGGRVELLIERIQGEHQALAHVRASKSPKVGGQLLLEGGAQVQVLGREQDLFALTFSEPLLPLLERIGHVPLPPYIDRPDEGADKERYQTVYARNPGAVAAPTAGLHFDEALLHSLAEKGVEMAFVTLHVGAGTFQPVRVEEVERHQMHSEWLQVDDKVVAAVERCRAAGGRVVAVGTTSVRSLETAAHGGTLKPYAGDTDIFIYPGYQFQGVDALVTNFHLPQSTLLMLVSAFAGFNETMAAYREAVAQGYRFFSYGDAMFITRNPHVQGPDDQ